MGIFGLNLKDRRTTIALQLGLNPDDRKNWPIETIDRILREAEIAAERTIDEIVYHMARSGHSR